jgi:ankyrin repeat protein
MPLVIELAANVNHADYDGGTSSFLAAQEGNLDVLRCLVKELGANVNQAKHDGATPLFIAAQKGHVSVLRCLVKELGADVNQTMHDGSTPLFIAAQLGHMDIVRCLVKEIGADINQAKHSGSTPLMTASYHKHGELVQWLVKEGADPQATHRHGTAAEVSKVAGASVEQTAYLEAKAHCSHPGCSGPGLMKCTGCSQARYCGKACQLAHWTAQKVECKQRQEELRAGKLKRNSCNIDLEN